MLAEGGNAVDACVAAASRRGSTRARSPAPGGGGFMLVHRARDGSTRLLDFFVAVPGLGLRLGHGARRWRRSTSTSPATRTQVFKIGAASCAVPARSPGSRAAHRLFGKLPVGELIAPAIELARDGRRAHAPAGVPARDPRSDPARTPPRAGRSTAPDGAPRRRRPAGDDRPRRHARADRRGGRGRRPRRRARPRARRACPATAAADHAARPGRVPRRPAPAGVARRTAGTSSSRTRRRRPAGS